MRPSGRTTSSPVVPGADDLPAKENLGEKWPKSRPTSLAARRLIWSHIMEQLLYTIDETAQVLRASRSSIYRLVKSGHLVSIKVNGSRRVTRQAIDRFVENLEKQSRQQSNVWGPR